MSTQAWIILAAVLAVLVVVLVAGFVLLRRRRVSLKAPETDRIEEGLKDRSGGYKAGGGFSF
ncbi:MAG: signal recognition particle-docking protein FtsY, partial [Rhodococcus sp. (in: high G+C Gram-positive bacteria)]